MIRTLSQLIKAGNVTQRESFPDLPEYSRGLPMVSGKQCTGCNGNPACVATCPTNAITVTPDKNVTLDLQQCLVCGDCIDACPSGTIQANRSTQVAVRNRKDLVLTNDPAKIAPSKNEGASTAIDPIFMKSLHIREVSTGDNATDLEVAAANNPIFDSSRFGIHYVASPRYADALLVTGPVAEAMQEPLRRCYDAMAEPRIVIAAGVSAISGGLHQGGYAGAGGVDNILPVSVYIPGNPPHPWYILHGILLAMGKIKDRS